MKYTHKGRNASSLVEFALVIPILAVVLFAIIQWGFIFGAYITVRNASAVGARQALINSNTAPATAQAALGPMLNPSLAGITASITSTTLPSGNAYAMTVTYPLPLIIPFVVPPFVHTTSTKTISATTIIR